MGGEFVGVRVAALNDLPLEELIEAPVTYCDGLNDNWWNAPAEPFVTRGTGVIFGLPNG